MNFTYKLALRAKNHAAVTFVYHAIVPEETHCNLQRTAQRTQNKRQNIQSRLKWTFRSLVTSRMQIKTFLVRYRDDVRHPR